MSRDPLILKISSIKLGFYTTTTVVIKQQKRFESISLRKMKISYFIIKAYKKRSDCKETPYIFHDEYLYINVL